TDKRLLPARITVRVTGCFPWPQDRCGRAELSCPERRTPSDLHPVHAIATVRKEPAPRGSAGLPFFVTMRKSTMAYQSQSNGYVAYKLQSGL
ncbi:hypothetical protein ABTK61_19140, partial [Acinetobacter baumannii]